MDLHLPRPESRHRRYQDDTAELSGDHLVLDREDDQERSVQIHVDRLEPELVRQLAMVADVADRATMSEQVDRPQPLSCLRDEASHVVGLGDVAGDADRLSARGLLISATTCSASLVREA